jgi:CHAT domain-containing protein
MPGADVIHLATHGSFDREQGTESAVLLAAGPRAANPPDPGSDGRLRAWEIMSQLRLRAELVVLSACETGRGRVMRGEGIVGLVRALQYAGARSIVASQWAVADASTATLMQRFHEGFRAGLPKDEALRRAMGAVRQDARTAHPYFWAPFFLTGDPERAPPAPRKPPPRRLSAEPRKGFG